MRNLLIAAMLLGAAPAWAEWVPHAHNERASFYYDPATIKRNGTLRRVWTLINQNEPDKAGAWSRRAFHEYDCKEDRSRFLSISTFSEKMANGKLIGQADYSDDSWTYIAPGTIDDSLLKIVCKRMDRLIGHKPPATLETCRPNRILYGNGGHLSPVRKSARCWAGGWTTLMQRLTRSAASHSSAVQSESCLRAINDQEIKIWLTKVR